MSLVFNSLPFLLFISVFLPVYYMLRGRSQLWLCLLASYFFYGWWDWRFLGLIAASTAIDYIIGRQLAEREKEAERKWLLWTSVLMNLSFLGFFKYFNFFIDSFIRLLDAFGLNASIGTLDIILPVGISFYTFQSMSYTIDIYRNKLKPERDWLRFATYIAFFPQLVAGPIVRASDFLPQLSLRRSFDWTRVISGLGQVLWGFFKKVAIADSLALFVDQCFAAPYNFGGLHLFIGVFFYAFQIYCDFSGYSDIAIGLARMMGFDFPKNFNLPYISSSFSAFWRRWHITLSTWLRDYLYIPLGGNRHGTLNTYRNLMITMLLGGLWHGANWTFVFWGFLHGFYLVIERLLRPWTNRLPSNWLLQFGRVLFVFTLTNIAWVFFRSVSFSDAQIILKKIIFLEDFTLAQVVNKFIVLKGGILIAILLFIEWLHTWIDFERTIIKYPLFGALAFSVLLWLIAFLWSIRCPILYLFPVLITK